MIKILTLAIALASCAALAIPAGAESKIALPEYSVTVTLSKKAAAKLNGSGETITIRAYYFGDPVNAKDQNESGDYSLNSEDKVILGAGSATLGKISINAKDLAKVKGHEASVSINIFTSRKVFPDNLLDCEIFEDKVAVALQKPMSLRCKLIGE